MVTMVEIGGGQQATLQPVNQHKDFAVLHIFLQKEKRPWPFYGHGRPEFLTKEKPPKSSAVLLEKLFYRTSMIKARDKSQKPRAKSQATTRVPAESWPGRCKLPRRQIPAGRQTRPDKPVP